MLLKAVSRVFQDFRYVRTFLEEDGRGMALVFEAKVGTRRVEGVDLLRLDAHGLVDDFRVMVRPHSALEALMTAMVPMIELVLADQGSAGLSATRRSRRQRASPSGPPRWSPEPRPRTGRTTPRW